jgi:hypothetical protein
MVFNQAYAWIHKEIVNDEWGVKIITQGFHFWKWWSRLWNIRNRNFYNEYLAGRHHVMAAERHRLLSLYEAAHSVENFVAFPGRKVVEETYAICIQRKIDYELKHAVK